jgi:hexosaminidase
MRYLVILVLFILCSCSKEQVSNQADQLFLKWELVENSIQPEQQHQAKLIIKNKGDKPLKPNWEIYFNTIFLSLEPEILEGEVEIEHLSGDFFKLKPKDLFPVLKSGQQYEIHYLSNNFLTKTSHAPDGLYIVFDGSEEACALPNYYVHPLAMHKQQGFLESTSVPLPTSNYLFGENASLHPLKPSEFSPIVPTPFSWKWGEGELVLQGDILIDEGDFPSVSRFFREWVGGNLKGQIQISKTENAPIRILHIEEDMGQEGYRLTIADQVIIEASHEKGAFYAFQSLMALLPVDFFADQQNNLVFPKVLIEDQPRFEHRGLFLDVARNFQSKESVKKLLDLMSFYKLNVFHINLANDEGWRIEIPGLPELTEVGSKRGHSPSEEDFLWPYYASGHDPEASPNGTGYWSKEDFVEILKYAQDRHIKVIPEIGVPAHSRAAIISMRKRYHRLMEEGKEEEAKKYLLEDFEDSSQYLSAQNFRGNTICICQESAFTFYEKIVDEILNMYSEANVPIQTFHTGGDEVPKGVWTASPICEKFITSTSGVDSVEELTDYFYKRIQEIFEQKGLQTAGWEEIGQIEVEENGESQVRPNPEFAEAGFRVYAWNAVAGWGGEDMAYQLANAGYEVIVCNSSNIYFDLAYNLDPEEPGHEWSGYVDLKAAWRMVPLNNFISNEFDMYGRPIDQTALAAGKTTLSEAGKKNIKGIQGQLWTETVKGQDMMEYYLLPKMLGLVERAWSKDPDWASIIDQESRLVAREVSWNQFANAVGQRELPRLDYIFGGFNTRLPKPGAVVVDGLLHANVENPGLEIRYTRNGEEPDRHSPLYSAELPVEGTIKLKSFTPSGKSSGTTIVK